LDFDHQPGAKKSACVSRMVSLSQKRLAEEVAKCVVLCSNCHRVQTHLRRHGTLDVQMSKRVKRWECLRRNFADLMEIKSRPCMDCNKTFHPTAMDLDHLDPTQKLGEPSELAKGARTS
jgi:5-methylcytosine-specific restriction endonuclease McrA